MKQILITGMSGTGKSTVSSALNAKGMNTIDLDQHADLCWMYYKDSGKPVETDFNNHDIEWVKSVEWLCDKENLKKLMDKQNSITYYCGSADNIADVVPLFDQVVLLHVDDRTFRKRLSERKNNDWARTNDVQDWLMNQKENYESTLIDKGAIPIETSQSIENVVVTIMEITA